jgi:hypothetical protein
MFIKIAPLGSASPSVGAYKYTFVLRISFHLLQRRCNTCTNTINKWYDPLHIITWPYWFINLDITCSSPLPSSISAKSCSNFTATQSIPPKPPSCPSRLQLVHQAKSCLDLLHLSHMTQYHVSCAMSSFITCVSFATFSSHLHRHGICCSHICTCRLIICISHSTTY